MGKKWFWFEKNPLKATAFFMLERMIIKTSPIVHVVSKATASDYRTYGGKSRRLFVIYNFLDLPSREEIDAESISFKEYFSLEDGERGILYFGRPAKNKGIFVMLDAISQLPQEKVEKNRIRFCFILAKAPENDYKKAIKVIKESSLSRYIIVKESLPRKELLKVVSEADLCVIPSVTEGFGYAAAEACVLNGRVISSDAGSLKEVVGGTCRFFKNRNYKDLAEKILSYMNEGTDSFLTLKEKRFDKELITKEYLDMYRTVLHDTF